MDFKYQLKKELHAVRVTFIGDINEDAELVLVELKNELTTECFFNMKQIRSINSCGVRAWINFMRTLDSQMKIYFEECAPEVVGQINMIPNFRGNAKVLSVYSSYVCETCEIQDFVLFEEGKTLPKTSNERVPIVSCKKCKQAMEMEELEDEFFAWLD